MSAYFYDVSYTCEFSAAHKIHGIDGPCSRLHGHNWKMEVSVTCHKLDDVGFSIDFYWLENLVKNTLLAPLDHQYLNEAVVPFDTINPTCENIGHWCFERIEQELSSHPNVFLSHISLWENSRFKVTIRKAA